ncbi:hypothetical protein PF010_g9551 [Phytophthora fragariae]|nr:hypothetical protein PF003_g18251 [Phytophthora fragariae]KAE8940001.1 hypothetical protein PF009_g10169 [Phytophthora fragariae]KAE9012296.1 hypothetical protein PF011_g8988 [Phytophthora fragariae]KAE9114517.1 hypothetical protein PF007_g10340 [Phytophthora fragariae]KAE9114868.1 hypothetical protein PF010_g9551 [Phytophthora fragariae]
MMELLGRGFEEKDERSSFSDWSFVHEGASKTMQKAAIASGAVPPAKAAQTLAETAKAQAEALEAEAHVVQAQAKAARALVEAAQAQAEGA